MIEDSLDRIRNLPAGPLPAPWRLAKLVFVGGLREIGIGTSPAGEEFVLVVSEDGRGVVSTSGEKVARDPTQDFENWDDDYQLTAMGIGPLEGQRIRKAGLAGGGLPLGTSDGWRVERFPVDWPEEHVVLEPPNTRIFWPGHEDGCVRLNDPTGHEIRTVGFSTTGRLLVVATAGDFTLYTRSQPAATP